MMMVSRRAALAPTVSSLWTWPIEIANYDRRNRLTAAEQKVLTEELAFAVANERTIGAMLGRLSGLNRLLAPIDDALAAIDGTHLYDDRVRLMLLQHCAARRQSFWAWDAAAWHIVLGTTQAAFFAAHTPKPHAGGERHALIAVAYLLRCFTDVPSLGELKRVALAEKIFGKERLASALRRVTEVSAAWGYRSPCKPLMSLVAELLLIKQQPELESLTGEFIPVHARPSDAACAFDWISAQLASKGLNTELEFAKRDRDACGSHALEVLHCLEEAAQGRTVDRTGTLVARVYRDSVMDRRVPF
jgi:hypothetical protein